MLDLGPIFAAFPVLTTPRLILRAVAPADADAMFAIMADPAVIRFFGTRPMPDRAAAARRIAGIRADFARQAGIRWAITLRAGGEFPAPAASGAWSRRTAGPSWATSWRRPGGAAAL